MPTLNNSVGAPAPGTEIGGMFIPAVPVWKKLLYRTVLYQYCSNPRARAIDQCSP